MGFGFRFGAACTRAGRPGGGATEDDRKSGSGLVLADIEGLGWPFGRGSIWEEEAAEGGRWTSDVIPGMMTKIWNS